MHAIFINNSINSLNSWFDPSAQEDAPHLKEQQVQVEPGPHDPGSLFTDLFDEKQHPGARVVGHLHQPFRRAATLRAGLCL